MKPETRRKVKEYIASFVDKQVGNLPYTVDELKKAYPFHSLFFPDEALKAFKIQRSLVTKMGQTLFPNLAAIIAREAYSDVQVGWRIRAELEVAKVTTINKILDELDDRKRTPHAIQETQEVFSAKGGAIQQVQITADVYVGDFRPGPLLLEVKTAQPKKEDCVRSKRRLLIFRAYYANKNPQAYIAFYYNPYIERERYNWWPTLQILDINNEVLIGQEMWEYLGGPGAYDQILQVVNEVREEGTRQKRFL
ncbi:MAG: TdeIII family type II restriction endonuclease [Dehalococcoidia bacterium]|nr:TdeIII family type II restriction endonuclease [Dehalococcoidia bacterium]